MFDLLCRVCTAAHVFVLEKSELRRGHSMFCSNKESYPMSMSVSPQPASALLYQAQVGGVLLQGICSMQMTSFFLWQVYSTMMAGYGSAGLFYEAQELMKEMQQRRVKPNEYTFTSLAEAFTNAGIDWNLFSMKYRGSCSDENSLARPF